MATSLLLSKYEALGNDFLVVEAPPEAFDGARAARLCDRRRGAGADGLLLLSLGEARDGVAEGRLTLFNADGSPAGFSGNGVRCAAAHALRDLPLETPLRLELGPTTSTLRVRAPSGPGLWVEAELPSPQRRLEAASGALLRAARDAAGFELPAYLVDVGNPHLVLVAPEESAAPAASLDALRADAPGFEDGINVTWFRPGPASNRAETFERGVGPTPSCASAAMACMLVARARGFEGGSMDLNVPGGRLTLGGSSEHMVLGGPVRPVWSGRWLAEP